MDEPDADLEAPAPTPPPNEPPVLDPDGSQGTQPTAQPSAAAAAKSPPGHAWSRLRLGLILAVAVAHLAWQGAVGADLLPNAALAVAALAVIAVAALGLLPQMTRSDPAVIRDRTLNLLLASLTVVLLVGMNNTVLHYVTDEINALLAPARSASPLDMERRLRIAGRYALEPLPADVMDQIGASLTGTGFRALEGRRIVADGVSHGVLAIGDIGLKGNDEGFLLGLLLGMTKDGIPGSIETIDGVRVAHATTDGIEIVMWTDLPAVYIVYVPDAGEVNEIVDAVIRGAPGP